MPCMYVRGYVVCRLCVNEVIISSQEHPNESSIRQRDSSTRCRGFDEGRRICKELGERCQALERAENDRKG
jgi:hypothetical protein